MRTVHFISVVVVLLFATQSFTQDSPSLGETARKLRAEKNKPAETQPASSDAKHQSETEAKIAEGLNADPAIDNYETEVKDLFNREKFDELEKIAADVRLNKSRFQGGVWKLHCFYDALAEPSTPDHSWVEHLQKLEKWKSEKPESITARVALADTYRSYGYEARGEGYSNTVTEEGWKLFTKRIAIARAILKEASGLKAKCPEWYAVMHAVIRDEGGERAEETAIFEQAIAFEPLYYYFYRSRAIFLLPKWHGEDGETERFADEISTKIGGKEGSIVYFEIAAEMVNQCNCDTQLKRMSWSKIREGHAAMEEKYGVSLLKVNQFARMAVRMADAGAAQKAFEQIGDNWDKDSWGSKRYFDLSKAWASDAAVTNKWLDEIISSVEKNMQSPEGHEYDSQIASEFQEQFATTVKQCVDAADTDLTNFDIFLQVGKGGSVQQMLSIPGTKVSQCLIPKLHLAAFAPPPKPDYWVKISMHFKP